MQVWRVQVTSEKVLKIPAGHHTLYTRYQLSWLVLPLVLLSGWTIRIAFSGQHLANLDRSGPRGWDPWDRGMPRSPGGAVPGAAPEDPLRVVFGSQRAGHRRSENHDQAVP